MKDNVYLFVPNLIGYGRVVLMFVAFYYMPTDPFIAASCYLLSEFIASDGHLARVLNQCTTFGTVLNVVTDRCSTAGLLVVLANFYPKYQFLFIFIIVLNISCHWVQVYSDLISGQSIKTVKESGNAILRLYRTSNVVLFIVCAGNEVFFAMLYMMHFATGPMVFGIGLFRLIALFCFPICVLKNGINAIYLVGDFVTVAENDVDEREKATLASQSL